MLNKQLIESRENIYWKINKLFSGNHHLGITDDRNDFQNLRTAILNAISIITILFVLIAYCILSFHSGFIKYGWVPLLTIHLFFVLYLNSKQQFKPAKVIFLVMNIIAIGAVSLIIRGAGIEYNLMVTICITPFLFSRKKTLIAYVSASAIVFVGVRYLATVLPAIGLYDSSHMLLSSLNLSIAVITVLFLIITFQRLGNKYSDTLILNNIYVQEKLTESKLHYNSLFENMIESYAYCEMIFNHKRPSDFLYLEVNSTFEKQTGLKNVVGKKISELVPGVLESNSDLFEIFGRVVKSGIPERFETYFHGLDKWFDISVYRAQPGYFIAVFDLISERKIAEDKQKLFVSIINSSEDAIISTLLDGTITSWNGGAEKTFGYTADDIIGKSIATLIPLQFRDEESEKTIGIVKGIKLVERYETQRITESGHHIYVSLSVSPIVDSSGNIIGFSKISRDISERKRSRQLLKTSLSFNKGILASLKSQIAVMNKVGIIIEVNKAWNDFAKANGETNLERVSIGSNYLEVCQKAIDSGDSIAADALQGILSVVHKEEPFFTLEYPCDSPTEKRWFLLQVTSFESDDQKIVVSHEDITKRKEAENAIVELNEHLEQKVEERTNDLSTSNKELGKKNQDITDSITYALRLQKALLPESKILFDNFPDAFIINLPQSIVSGDFYWFNKSHYKFMIACADSTGHGVPGAFMSIVGAQLLNHAIQQEWEEPSDILKLIDEGLTRTLAGNKDEPITDGMDMAFCIINPNEKKIDFSGALSSIILSETGETQVYQGSRFALGKYMQMKDKQFETKVIKYNTGDMLYMYSDGLKDQFGGEKNKKFRFDRQLKLFEEIHKLPAGEQERIIVTTFKEWKGKEDQVDDVMVIGLRL